MRNSLLLISSLMIVAACTDSGAGGGSDVSGASTYRDAVTSSDGTARAPAKPAPQTMRVSMDVRGTGTMSGLDATCLDGTAGQFHAVYRGNASLTDGGSVAAALDAAASLTTPSGCTIPSLSAAAVTDVKVRAELDATTTNCSSYCEASARADAEAQCAGHADQAACRASAETSAAASCTTTCTQHSHVIVAETSLAASALGTVDADALRGGLFGALHADFTFDHLE
jgi:hypothetical protein